MRQLDHQQAVLDLLNNLRGLAPLKELFWSRLNYDRVNQPLSRHNWTSTASQALAEDPLLFASGGADNDFHIIYARLDSDRLLLGMERPVVSRLLQDHPYALIVFSNAAQDRWHLLNVKYDERVEKRRLFRRITVGPEERLRTAAERIALLDLGEKALGPLDIQALHDEAFDVEAVTRQFFSTFAELYHKVADDIAQVRDLKDEAGRLAQLLLNRMLFLYFIQKKGWLDGKLDYLYSRFQECWWRGRNDCSYYSNVLYPLFLCLSDADAQVEGVGAVPFLNGGLFEEAAKQTQAEAIAHARLQIRNSTFKAVFDDLLERFNFTITEDTPLDVEVAIDPEMLGKIFESLILQLEKDPEQDLRKLTGSYYTPRPIVHFMCQEALKEYLVTQLAGDDAAQAETAHVRVDSLLALPPAGHLDEYQVNTLKELFTPAEAKMLRQSILDCRVCDPAVGSGAFPVGMLHEMVAAIARLDLSLKGPEALKRRNYDYDLKKQMVESCLYGVDIQEQAVRLCELRLWLSLVVDYELDPAKPFAQTIREVPSLPNLSYRIMRGDSLLERLFGHVIQLDQMARDARAKQLVESIQADKQAYFREGHTTEKRRLELKILAKQADLAERLIEAKQASMQGHYETSLFGEEGMTAKARKARAEFEVQVAGLDDLKTKVGKARAELERLSRQKRALTSGDLDALRRRYFQTGDSPTFMWRVDFAEVFAEKGGFDVVIGNPPYIDSEAMTRTDSHLRKLIQASYTMTRGNWDIYIAFYERGFNLNGNLGVLSFITPDKWISKPFGDEIRIKKMECIFSVLKAGREVFESVNVDAIVSLFTRIPQPFFRIYDYAGKEVRLKRVAHKKLLKPPYAYDWLFSDFVDLLTKIGAYGDSLFKYGICENACATSDAYKLQEFIQEEPSNVGSNEYLRIINTGTIGKYVSKWGQREMVYLGNRYFRPVVNKKRFQRAFVNSYGKKATKPKIILKGLNLLDACLDSDGAIIPGKTTLLIASEDSETLKLLLAIVNSSVAFFYLKEKYPASSYNQGTTFTKEMINDLPIPEITQDNRLKLVSAVDQIISAKRRDPGANTRELERKIDQLVYKLYDLTPDEIAIVQQFQT